MSRISRYAAALAAVVIGAFIPVVGAAGSSDARTSPRAPYCRPLPAGTTTWAAGSRRRVDCVVRVPVGARLRIAPGATVLFGRDAGIRVRGALVVAGTSTRPVQLRAATSHRWTGIHSTGDGSIDVRHAVITRAVTAIDAEPTAADPQGHTRVSDSRIRIGTSGVVARRSNETRSSLRVSVTDTDFRSLSRGVWISRSSHPTVVGNVFHAITGMPLRVTDSELELDSLRDNRGYRNATNVWAVARDWIDRDGTLATGPADPAPAGSTSPRALTPVLLGGGLVIGPGATVVVGPGVVKASGLPNEVLGSLDLEGTEADPVILTSTADGSVGDPAGPAAVPKAGDWQGLFASRDGTISARHAEIRYAEAGVSALGEAGDAVSVSIEDSTFVHDGEGVSTQLSGVTVRSSTFIDDASGVLTGGATHPVISDNSFVRTASVPVHVVAGTLDPDDLAGNTATDSPHPSMSVEAAVVDSDGAWPMGPSEWNPSAAAPGAGQSIPLTADVGGPLTIASQATVSFGPGAVKFTNGGFDVQGAAVVAGTAAHPAVFTASTDDQVGYPLGSANGPVTWHGLGWSAGADVSMVHAVFRGATRALTFGAGDTASLEHVEFANDTEAVHVDATAGSCVAPYGSTSVTGSDVWFGVAGAPGGLSALQDVTDQPSSDPASGYADAKAAYDAATAHYGALDASATDDTIAFADWACDAFSFPVTPVLVDVAPSAPFPAYAEVTGQ